MWLHKLWNLLKEIHHDQRGGTGTAVATDDLITAAKMNLKLEDYDLIDDQQLIFGTGDDLKVQFDAAKMLLTLASQFSFVVTGGHFGIETLEDNKNVRINSRDFVLTSGDATGVQIKPNVSVGGTTGITGLEVSPRFADGISGSKLVGIMSNPLMKGTTGDLSSAMRAYEGKLESPSGSTGTIAEAYVLHAMQALHGTVTAGPYVLAVDAGGGNVAWAGLMKLPDDAQIATKGTPTATLPANTAWFRVKVGDTFVKVACYAN